MNRKVTKNLNNSVLIVAHLDDEIIFASSLIDHVKKIIICFCSNSNEKELTKSRINLIKNFPNKKFIFLKFEENNALLKKLCAENLISSTYISRRLSKIAVVMLNYTADKMHLKKCIPSKYMTCFLRIFF